MMKTFTTLCLVAAFVLIASVSRAQVDCQVTGGTPPPINEGQEFLLCFMANEEANYDDNQYQDIYLAALDKAAMVRLQCPALSIDDSVQLSAFGSDTYPLSAHILRQQGALIYVNEFADSSCVYVSSSAPIVCYGMNHKQWTADAFLALPRHTAEPYHMVMSYANSSRLEQPRSSEFAVAAWEDSTMVTIKPTATTTSGLTPGSEFNILLNKHEAVQIQADPAKLLLDLTGTTIITNKPVAVWGGHQRAEVPVGYEQPNSNTSRDHLAEQLPPAITWGRRFVASNFYRGLDSNALPDLLRILALENNTSVIVNDVPVTTLASGKYFDTLISGAVLVETSGPALAGMYAHTTPQTNGNSDPFFAIVPPVDQYYKEFTFFISNDSVSYNEHHLMILTERSGVKNGIFLDGVQIPENINIFKEIPLTLGGMSFSIADMVVTPGIHRIRTNNPIEKGIAIVAYGWGTVDSYGYTAGSLLKPLQSIIKGDAPTVGVPRGAKPEPKVWLRSIIKVRTYFDNATITLDENTRKVYNVELKERIALDTRFIEGGENKGLDLVISPPNDEPVHGTMKVDYHTAAHRDLRSVTVPFTIEPQEAQASVGDEAAATMLSIEISPNPVTDFASISVAGTTGTMVMRVIDATGREVYRTARARVSGLETFRLDTRKLPAGVYSCEVAAAGGAIARRQLVVVR